MVGWKISSFPQTRLSKPFLIGVAAISLVLLLYGCWMLQLQRGAHAVDRGEIDRAAGIYAATERPFVGFIAQLFPDHYSRTIFPQVALLFGRGKLDDATRKLEEAAKTAPALMDRMEYSFWSGHLLLRRAQENEDPDIIMKNLYAASEQFRKSLEMAPDNWDVKYSFELVRYIVAQQELEKEKEDSRIKSILERMRTVTEPGEKEPPPPEKRG
jgi:tetratricopeptide (TPR) repeat protein